MKFSPKCRTMKLVMIYTILASFCLFMNWEEAHVLPQIRPRKILEYVWVNQAEYKWLVSMKVLVSSYTCSQSEDIIIWLREWTIKH